MRLAARAAVLLALAAPALTRAHDAGISYSELAVRGDGIEAWLRLSSADFAAALGQPAGRAAPAPEAARDGVGVEETLGRFEVAQDGRACRFERGSSRPEPPDGVTVSGAFRCDRAGGPIHVRVGLLDRMAWGHTHLAKVRADGHVEEHVARADRDGFDVRAEPARGWEQAWRFVRLGVEHIFTGYDHMAFLLGLLLLGGTLRGLLRVVTSFTLAHSVTLAVASLELASVPPRVVEPLIAASIVFVAVENLVQLRRPSPAADGRRWKLAFGFGLVHGFGFASALTDLHLARAELAAALFSFNVGVEAGQAVLAAVAFPLLAALRRRPAPARLGLRAGSLAIGAAGVLWLVERLPWR